MSRAAAWRYVEDFAWEDAPASPPDHVTPSPVPESGMRRCRSAAETSPVSDATLDPARPEWCVDTGADLRPMSTFDLWSAIERADVAPWMRVWREGLECWTPVQDLPELHWATHAGALASLDDSPYAAAAPELLPPERTPANEAREEARPGRTLPGLAAPEPRDSIATPAPTVAAPAPVAEATRAARWLAAGSTVAALSIGAALLHLAGPLSLAAPAVAPAAAAPALAAPPAAEPTEPTEIRPPAHREERGQRRLPRGGRRASYGR
jgi:hypothetical protein